VPTLQRDMLPTHKFSSFDSGVSSIVGPLFGFCNMQWLKVPEFQRNVLPPSPGCLSG
jgi:hypothetical protein